MDELDSPPVAVQAPLPVATPLRVQIAIESALDRLAYTALLANETPFPVVVVADAGDVRLADRCAAQGAPPTVVLGAPACACCLCYPRDGEFSGLLAVLRAAGGYSDEAMPPPSEDLLARLTRRERDVLRLVGQGLTVLQCAEAMGVARSTVGNHKYRLMRKLGVKTSLQLLRIAVRHGLAPID